MRKVDRQAVNNCVLPFETNLLLKIAGVFGFIVATIVVTNS